MLLLNNTVKAPEALAIGLINYVAPAAELPSAAMEIARQLAAAAPRALAATKRLLWAGIGLSVDASMPEESRTVAELCRTSDVQEGLSAVVGKRPAQFTGS